MGLLKLKGKVKDGRKVGDRNSNLIATCCFWAYKILTFLRRRGGNQTVKCQQVGFKK